MMLRSKIWRRNGTNYPVLICEFIGIDLVYQLADS